MDWYKINLDNSGTLIGETVPETEVRGQEESVYSYCEDGLMGIFAIRKSRTEAIDALKNSITDKIDKNKMELSNLHKKLDILCAQSALSSEENNI